MGILPEQVIINDKTFVQYLHIDLWSRPRSTLALGTSAVRRRLEQAFHDCLVGMASYAAAILAGRPQEACCAKEQENHDRFYTCLHYHLQF